MICKNILGGLESKANISVFGDPPYSKPYYCLHSTIDGFADRKWSIDTPVEHIVAEMDADGWVCSVRKDAYNRPCFDCVHRETQALIDERKKRADKYFVGAERGFIRFGEVPVSGRSINHRDDCEEKGVSCFDAEITKDGSYRLLLTPVLEVSYLTVMDREAYRLYGDVVGTGADGEPLLNVERCEKI